MKTHGKEATKGKRESWKQCSWVCGIHKKTLLQKDGNVTLCPQKHLILFAVLGTMLLHVHGYRDNIYNFIGILLCVHFYQCTLVYKLCFKL